MLFVAYATSPILIRYLKFTVQSDAKFCSVSTQNHVFVGSRTRSDFFVCVKFDFQFPEKEKFLGYGAEFCIKEWEFFLRTVQSSPRHTVKYKIRKKVQIQHHIKTKFPNFFHFLLFRIRTPEILSSPDCPTTTLSQDSLRLYKRRSKSDGALNRAGGGPRRRDSYADPRRNPSSASHMEISKHRDYQHYHYHQQQPHVLERKYAQHETSQSRTSLKAHDESAYYRTDRVSQATRYKLNRKSRSLGDLDCSELDEKQEDGGDTGTTSSYETESRRRYKPVPKLRSKESLRRVKMSTPVRVASWDKSIFLSVFI